MKPKITDPNLAISQGVSLLDAIAPQSIDEDFDYIKINDIYFRTIFVGGYPRFVAPGWLEPVINIDTSLDIAFYVYPVDGKSVLDDLRRKIAEMEAEMSTDIERGKIVDPTTQAKLEDAQALQEQLVKGIERFYEFSFYITIPANSVEELNRITKQVESQLGSLMVVAKHAMLDMESGFLSTAPFGMDRLNVTRNMDTTSVATTFPLTSTELSSDRGVLYGINSQNESFIIFDRFSLENANMTIFATSGAGKCSAFDTTLTYRDKNKSTHQDSIGNIVDNLINKHGSEKFDEKSEGLVNPNIEVFTYDNNLKGGWSKVEAVSRKETPNIIYNMVTKSGRKITLTGDHSVVVLKNSEITTVKGSELSTGQFIPIPRKIDPNEKTVKDMNVASILGELRYKYVIQNKRIGTKRYISQTSLPTTILLTDEFFQTVGLFIAEGTVLPTQSVVTNENQDVINLISSYYKSLGINYYYGIKQNKIIGVRTGTQVFCDLLIKLGISGKAGLKSVPDVVFSASNNQISKFLQGYYEGDGGVENHEITAMTKSKNLASSLAYLLLHFGIIARISERMKSATNTIKKTKRKYYRISISGQDNIMKYINQIGFITKEKNDKSLKLLKESNTNIDTIPELQSIFKEIYAELYNSENPAPKKFSEIKLGMFKPSREELLDIIPKIRSRIYEIESLGGDGISKLQGLPTIKQIVDKGTNKKTNALLWKNLGHSWQTMRAGVQPYTKNALAAAKITYGYEVEIDEVGRALYRSFKFTGKSLQKFDSSLWADVLYKDTNSQYKKIIDARNYITGVFDQKIKSLAKIKEKIDWLETLAKSDLFWDPIVKITKIRSKHPYVYDLQVSDGVFLAGFGGMFVHNSYFVKLEALRSLMTGTEVIVIDPESEYKPLAEAVGGEYIDFSFNSPSKINPFDLAQIREEGENQLGQKILSLHSLLKVIMGAITPTQEALLDRALVMTYRNKGITIDPETQTKEPPLMEDLYKTLVGMEVADALDLAARIEKFIRGSFVGIFDKQTNISITNPFTVFSVKDMQDALRPIAMFIILDFIWTKVKKDLKKRILVAEEAWQMMKYPDTAQFLWSVVKRARKYYLGLTTITQDVEDFLSQDIGKAIVTNSAMQVLLKQSPAAIDKIGEVFYLSQGEKNLLLAANVGEGIFFAGPHHAPIRVVASEEENKLITTKPQELAKKELENKS